MSNYNETQEFRSKKFGDTMLYRPKKRAIEDSDEEVRNEKPKARKKVVQKKQVPIEIEDDDVQTKYKKVADNMRDVLKSVEERIEELEKLEEEQRNKTNELMKARRLKQSSQK